MRNRLLPCLVPVASALFLILTAASSRAQMTPLQDQRQDHAQSRYQDVERSLTNTPPTAYAYWEDTTFAVAEKYVACENPPPDLCLVGSASAFAYQISQFYPAGIQLIGSTSGSWGIPPDGDYSFVSNAGFMFRIDYTVAYDLFVDIDPGDWPSQGTFGGAVRLSAGTWPGNTIHQWQSGVVQTTGFLGPGIYTLEGWSSGGNSLEYFQGATYSAQWTIHSVFDPIIKGQPTSHVVAPGGVALFSVATAGPQSNYTYQWLRNQVPLTNGGHVNGATTSTLFINSASYADSGDYNVVVTGIPPGGGSPPGTPRSEPSGLAHLGITSVTGVESDPGARPTTVVVRAPSPNPFFAATSVHYEAPQPGRLVATVYSVTGAKLLTIADGEAAGAGVVTWDGRLRSGARAPVGVYFIQVEIGGVRETKKVMLAE